MSVCDDERWIDEKWQTGYVHECPCYSDHRSVYYCGLYVYEPHDSYDLRTGERQDNRPDSCPFADILKALKAADEMGEVEDVHDQPDGWGHISFTLKRGVNEP